MLNLGTFLSVASSEMKIKEKELHGLCLLEDDGELWRKSGGLMYLEPGGLEADRKVARMLSAVRARLCRAVRRGKHRKIQPFG